MPEDGVSLPDEGRMAPRWLAEMRRNASRTEDHTRPHGFYVNYQKFAAVHVARGHEVLMVTFDNLSAVNDDALGREAWGDKFFAENNWSSLGILSFEANWYRDEILFDYLESLRDQGFFARYKKVVFTGTSMGGYAALAFSGLAPGATVLAYSPQSTLDEALVPWEDRFKSGRKQDWSGRYRDTSTLIGDTSKAYLCYDPYMPGDKAHADRIKGDQVVHLHTNYVGHKNVVFLRRADILKHITMLCVTGDMTPAIFNQLYRSRRKLPWYYYGLMDMALKRGHMGLSQRIIRAAKQASGNPNLTGALQKRRKMFLGQDGDKA